MTLSAFMDAFQQPGSEYRGAPFWAWNGKLEPEELRRQIRLMHEMGLGGFFMHSRVGLDTAYLSEEWFKCIDACVDEAEKLDMQPWLYDEDRWPSGAAGGLVTKDKKYRMRSLVAMSLKNPADLTWDKDTMAAFFIHFEDGKIASSERVRPGRKVPRIPDGYNLVVFRVRLQAPSSWYNDCTYLDTMSQEAVEKFIEVTHEAYAKHLGKKLGKRVPGIFTDEPNYGRVLQQRIPEGEIMPENGLEVPWTGQLPEVFADRYGYDLLDKIPEVYFDTVDHPISQARYHYHDCKTFMFVDAFARQIGEWCNKTKCQHTGHVLSESPVAGQVNVVGSAMRFYEYMQAPGMDLLRQNRREYDTAKGVSSAAHQFGRKWRLTETYGCTGWDFPFAGHKAQSDWQAALGINLRCQHLAWYTMEGQAKRDYPAAIFYQSPWWQQYPLVEDYFARIHQVMTRGEEVRDLLVIHPNESFWPYMSKGWNDRPEIDRLDRQFVRVRDALLAANIDFDFGDEDILSRHGRVETYKKRKKKTPPDFIVAKAAYKAVLVPPVDTLRRSTLELLREFAEAGGLVVFAGKRPQCIDAEVSIEAVALARQCVKAPIKKGKLSEILSPKCRRISILDKQDRQIPDTLHLLREDGDGMYAFIINTGHNYEQTCAGSGADLWVAERDSEFPEVTVQLQYKGTGKPLEFDPTTGEIFLAESKKIADGWEVQTSLPKLGSRLFVFPRRKQRRKPPAKRPTLKRERTVGMGGEWEYALSEANCLVLDRPQCRMGKGKYQKADEILRVDHAVRDRLGIQRRGGRMVQPWAVQKKKNPKSVQVTLLYEFEAKAVPTGEMFLAIERPDTFEAKLNSHEIDMKADAGYWVDKSLRKFAVDPAAVKKGKNELRLLCNYDENHPGLEIVYLLGDFGAKVKGTKVTMTALPEKLDTASWTGQDLAFYSGNVAYRRNVKTALKKGQRLFVEVPEYKGVAVRVLVDGKEAGVFGWEPNRVEITDLITSDRADIAIEVIGHRRNSHGPLHHPNPKLSWVGPGEYVTSGDNWTDDYQLVDVGLTAPARLVFMK